MHRKFAKYCSDFAAPASHQKILMLKQYDIQWAKLSRLGMRSDIVNEHVDDDRQVTAGSVLLIAQRGRNSDVMNHGTMGALLNSPVQFTGEFNNAPTPTYQVLVGHEKRIEPESDVIFYVILLK